MYVFEDNHLSSLELGIHNMTFSKLKTRPVGLPQRYLMHARSSGIGYDTIIIIVGIWHGYFTLEPDRWFGANMQHWQTQKIQFTGLADNKNSKKFTSRHEKGQAEKMQKWCKSEDL
jgi:hypothetical protein